MSRRAAPLLSTGIALPVGTGPKDGRQANAATPTAKATARPATAPTRRGVAAPRRPDPARLASVLVTVWIDVLDGLRPMAQLRDHLAPALERQLTAQLATRPGATRHRIRKSTSGGQAQHSPHRERPRVRTARAQSPTATSVESVVLVERDDRVSAYAVRLERHEGSWRAVELTAPESGLAALRTRSRPVSAPRPDAFDTVLGDVD